MQNRIGLVMTGGGARGAYQAGVLKRVSEIDGAQAGRSPFPIIGGASAGAVNGTMLAVGCDDFRGTAYAIADMWAHLRPSDIFHCDFISQAHNSLTWILDLSLGALSGGGHARHLLDAAPLRQLLSRYLDCDRIQANIRRGDLYALAISATNFNSGKSYLFIQGAKGIPIWQRVRLGLLPPKSRSIMFAPRLRFHCSSNPCSSRFRGAPLSSAMVASACSNR